MRVVDYQTWISSPERAGSREYDFGVWWKVNGKGAWRVSLIERTGELYAVPSAPAQQKRKAIVLAEGVTEKEARELLGEWNRELTEVFPELVQKLNKEVRR